MIHISDDIMTRRTNIVSGIKMFLLNAKKENKMANVRIPFIYSYALMAVCITQNEEIHVGLKYTKCLLMPTQLPFTCVN